MISPIKTKQNCILSTFLALFIFFPPSKIRSTELKRESWKIRQLQKTQLLYNILELNALSLICFFFLYTSYSYTFHKNKNLISSTSNKRKPCSFSLHRQDVQGKHSRASQIYSYDLMDPLKKADQPK